MYYSICRFGQARPKDGQKEIIQVISYYSLLIIDKALKLLFIIKILLIWGESTRDEQALLAFSWGLNSVAHPHPADKAIRQLWQNTVSGLEGPVTLYSPAERNDETRTLPETDIGEDRT